MNHYTRMISAIFIVIFLTSSCNKKIKQQDDEIYSRHLQEHIRLTIINTPMPEDRSKLNLLLLNDGQEIEAFRVKKIIDSLFNKKIIQPLVVVAIHPGNRNQEYGVSGTPDYKNNGSRAEKYVAFIDNELYPYIKKKTGVRKFNSVVFAGCSLGGLSALDIAWNKDDKIDKVGVFSGSFWWRDKDINDKDYSDGKDRIMLNSLKSSRKKPHLKYWFYAGGNEEDGDRDKDGIIDVIDDTKDLIEIIKDKNVCPPSDIVYKEVATGKHDYASWSNVLPEFLTWAFKN